MFSNQSFANDKIQSETTPVYNLELIGVKEAKSISEELNDKLNESLVLFVGSPNAYVYGNIVRIDGVGGLNSFKDGDQIKFTSEELGLTPVIVDNRTLIPLRFVSESFGGDVEWIDETKTAKISIENKEIIFKMESNLYFVNGQEKRLDVAPKIIKNRMFIPFRALAESLSYNVFWDKSGIVVMSKNEIFSEEDDSLIKELEQSFYNYTSADIQHPFKYRFIEMLDYADRDNLRKHSLTDLQNALGTAYTFGESEYIADVQAEVSKQKFLDTPSTVVRKNTHRFASCYIKTGDDFYARRAILTMYHQAIYYDSVPKEISTRYALHLQALFGQLYFIPTACVNAYDILYYSNQWRVLSEELGVDVRKIVEDWFRKCVLDALDFFGGNYVQNTNGSCVPPAIFTAMIINDAPLLHRALYEFEELLFSGYEFHADGMWHEGTYSYLSDTIDKHSDMLPLFVYYTDPLGYKDEEYNYSLNYVDGYVLFPMAKKATKVLASGYFPNGIRIPLQDTHPVLNKDPNKEIKEKYLNNIELYHFGHYALTHGDTKEAQQVHLSFYPATDGYPYSGRHHYQYANLPIILWGGGMEVLPDMAYVDPTTMIQNSLRLYPNYHNAGFIWTKDENYWNQRSMFSRPATLAYDDGNKSGKKVQLIEASVLGADVEDNKIDIKRRLLLMVETEGNRSYTFDLQRLKGGDAHENYLISGEEERTTLETSLKTVQHEGTLKDLLQTSNEGYPEGRQYLTSPMSADGSEAFSFRWTGKESGTSLNIHMNGIPGSEVFFSTYPSFREAKGDKSKEYDFPGWHFYRRNKVRQSDITRYAAVYETSKKGENEFVKGITWVEPQNPDPMCISAIVDMGQTEDIIYISDDTIERNVNGILFSGNIAILRRNKETKETIWSYIYGEGKIKTDNYEIIGKKTKKFKVIEANGGIEESAVNYLKIKGSLSDDDYSNVWLKVKFPDKTGWALKIKEVDQSYIYTYQHPAFEVTDSGGSNMLFYPKIEAEMDGKMRITPTDLQGVPLSKLREQKNRGYENETWIEVNVPTFVEK